MREKQSIEVASGACVSQCNYRFRSNSQISSCRKKLLLLYIFMKATHVLHVFDLLQQVANVINTQVNAVLVH